MDDFIKDDFSWIFPKAYKAMDAAVKEFSHPVAKKIWVGFAFKAETREVPPEVLEIALNAVEKAMKSYEVRYQAIKPGEGTQSGFGNDLAYLETIREWLKKLLYGSK